jgi:hypothetical protein
MSILHRSAYLTLSALLAIVPAACGDDDDDGNNDNADDNTGDDTGTPDAAVVDIDAAVVDIDAAVGGADASPPGGGVLSGSFLLAILAPGSPLGDLRIRAIMTVNHTPNEEGGLEGTADLTIQSLFAPTCTDQGKSGEPDGDPLPVNDVPVDADGAFSFSVTDAVIPPGAIDNATACGLSVTASLSATGGVVGDENETCGDVTTDPSAPVDLPPLVGTFGTVRLEEPVMTGDDNLPTPVESCPALLPPN